MLSPDHPSNHPTEKYRSLTPVSAIELSSGPPHAKGTRHPRTTHPVEIRNNTVKVRTVSGQSKC